MKPSTLTQAIDAHMGEEKQNRKQKEGQMKETGKISILTQCNVSSVFFFFVTSALYQRRLTALK